MKRLLIVMCVALAVGCIAGAAGAAPYVIGAIFSTTGDNAPLGVPERETVEMLVKQLNAKGGIKGRKVKVEFYDDGGKPEQAVQACEKLRANKDVLAIIGPTLSGPSLAISDICQKAGIPLVSCAASIKIVSPVKSYVFKTAQSDTHAVSKVIDMMKRKKIKTVGFIHDANAFGASGRDEWKALSPKSGIKTVAVESFNTSDTDMTSQLTSIRKANPDAIVCWGTNPGPAIVAKNASRLGLKQPIYMSHGIANQEFINLAQRAAEGILFPAGKLLVANEIPKTDPQRNVLLAYSSGFTKAYKKPANTFGGHAYDAFMLVTRAIGKVGPDRAKIRKEIENTKAFVGVSGVFNFSARDHNGLTKQAFAPVVISGGKWRIAK